MAMQVVQAHLAVGVCHREIWRGRPDSRRHRAAVTTGQRKGKDNGKEGKGASHLFIIQKHLMGVHSHLPQISVIVPARNEEECLGRCLESLVAQTGAIFEIIVVDDDSSDRTRQIAESFDGVRVIDAGPLRSGWTGKNNAMRAGATQAHGAWLLFTDADTVHLPGSVKRSLTEAVERQVELLSFSPEQEVHGFWEKAVMPVIFAELTSRYRLSDINDPESPSAAANGQYILVSREAYEAVGGQAVVAGSLLEDVALARAFKQSGYRIFFRYGGDAVRTRMYRSFGELREGWTKNLVLLFPSPVRLAVFRLLEFWLILASCFMALIAWRVVNPSLAILFLAVTVAAIGFLLARIRTAHFSWGATALSPFGLPLFSYLLLRSWLFYTKGSVSWKGRNYATVPQRQDATAMRAAPL